MAAEPIIKRKPERRPDHHSEPIVRQRAFRDALTDVLPAVHGWLPTLRIADFEVSAWVHQRGAKAKMSALVADRIKRAGR